MSMTEPSTAPERELPEAIEEAIEEFRIAVFHAGTPPFTPRIEDASTKLRHAILAALDTAADTAWHDGYGACRADLAALEPERALRERAERLRIVLKVMIAHPDMGAAATTEAVIRRYLHLPSDLDDNILAATSSAHEARVE